MDALEAEPTITTTASSTQPHGACTLDQTLRDVLESVTRSIGLVEHAGVVVGRAPDFHVTAASDPLAARVQDCQAALAEGPSIDALTTGLTVVSDSLDDERRWPGWRAEAVGAGVASAICLPLLWEGRTLGALGLYWTSPHRLDTTTLDLAETCGLTVSAIVGWARSAQELQRALATRQMIGQAVGVLMQRHGLSSEAAFGFLRRNSQNANIKLRDVAAKFLATGELPQPPRSATDRPPV